MIRTQELIKIYNGVPAVDRVNLEVPEGELCVLLGPSGCGKSTLIKMINALVTPTSGEIFVNGKNTQDIPPEILRRGIGYVVQNVGLFPHYTVRRNIAVVMKLLKKPQAQIDRRVMYLLDLIGLPRRYADRYPRELSGGEARRVAMAARLVLRPEALLLDEPTSGMDRASVEHVKAAVMGARAAYGTTLVIASHDLDWLSACADTVLTLEDGRIVAGL